MRSNTRVLNGPWGCSWLWLLAAVLRMTDIKHTDPQQHQSPPSVNQMIDCMDCGFNACQLLELGERLLLSHPTRQQLICTVYAIFTAGCVPVSPIQRFTLTKTRQRTPHNQAKVPLLFDQLTTSPNFPFKATVRGSFKTALWPAPQTTYSCLLIAA